MEMVETMTYFILQTLFWLVLAFIVGLLLGRWLKALLCRQNETHYSLEGGHAGYKADTSAERTSTYTGTADKLAFRDTSEFDTSSSTTSSDSSASFKAAATAAVAGAAAYSLSDDETDNEIKVDHSASSRNVDLDTPTEIDSDIAMRKEGQAEIDELVIDATVDDASIAADGIWEDDLEEASADSQSSVSSAGIGTTVAAGAAAVAMSSGNSDSEVRDLGSDEDNDEGSIVGTEQGHDNNALFAKLEISNLRVIEGIGPVMEKVLHKHGVHNWTDLSMKSDADLRDILDTYEDNKYKGVEIEGWVEQAKLAANGKVDELIALQKQDEGDEISQLEVWLDKLR
jgi:predicted flap endonuclease-1-like 5' DNA nuclease